MKIILNQYEIQNIIENYIVSKVDVSGQIGDIIFQYWGGNAEHLTSVKEVVINIEEYKH